MHLIHFLYEHFSDFDDFSTIRERLRSAQNHQNPKNIDIENNAKTIGTGYLNFKKRTFRGHTFDRENPDNPLNKGCLVGYHVHKVNFDIFKKLLETD